VAARPTNGRTTGVTFNAPRLRNGPRPAVLLPIVLVLALIVLALTVGTNLYVDLLFYRAVHFSEVFSTVLATRVVLFAVAAVLAATVLGTNLVLGYLLRPPYVPMSPEQQNLESYRVALQPYRKALLVLVSAIFGVLFGMAAQGRWTTWQLWLHGQQFGVKDPQFHRDISYYAFTLPFERMVLGYAFAAIILSGLVTVGMHYLYGGIRLQTRGQKVSAAAKAHLSVLLGIFVLLKAAAYWLDRYGLNFSPRGRVTGAGYTDVHATLPSKNILVVIAVLCAGLFFANAFRRGSALPAISFGLLVLSAVVIGGIYPAIVQQFKVKPNEINREATYIGRNITATRTAYGIVPRDTQNPGGSVVETPYTASAAPATAAVRNDKTTVPNARLLDPQKLQPTFEQLQQVRSYYGFAQTLDVDRYTVAGAQNSYVVAARELDLTGLQPDQRNWPNEHLTYTHGQGFAAAQTGNVDPTNGRPIFSVKNIPATGNNGPPPIPITQPRIYYGEKSPTYSIVDSTQNEIDGPDQADYHYNGSGGVKLGSKLFRRLAFSLHFKDYQLYFSSAVNSNSKIMYNRNPRDRVGKVAPWLRLDGDPYPAVVGGRIVWIVDGYTTSNGYPYSERVSFGDATADSTTNTANVSPQGGQINYIRNSVKATVDAFDGTVTLFAFEQGHPDPVLRTWEKVFPHSVQAESAIPTELRAHLRYPEDLFKVQRDLLVTYHVTDPQAFFRGGDFWSVPPDPTIKNNQTVLQPPYYIEAQVPGQSSVQFNLTTSLNFRQRPNLAAFVAVSSDPVDYGTIRVLDLPNQTVINGPGNVESAIQSDARFGPTLTLLDQQGSQIIIGNLLTLPVGDSFLFVEPFYAEATSGQTFPTLKYVVVVYGDKVGFAPTLADAVSQALAGGGGVTIPTQGNNPTTSTSPPPASSQSPGPTAPVGNIGVLADKVKADADAVRAAQGSGDLAKINVAQQQYSRDLASLVAGLNLPGSAATGAPGGARPTPSPAGK